MSYNMACHISILTALLLRDYPTSINVNT